MSNSDPSVLGKRPRGGVDDEEQDKLANKPIIDSASHANDAANESDDEDDIGPMPMPANSNAVKKKRKGMLDGSFFNPMASNDARHLFSFLPRM